MMSRRYSWLFLIPLFITLAGGILYYDSYAKGIDDSICTIKVGSNFKPYYDSVKDRGFVFGCPITPEFIDTLSNYPMQYFQRVRLELVVNEKTGVNEVVITPLGEWLIDPEKLISAEDKLPLNTVACKVLDNPKLKQSFHVCLDFLKYFEAHGGIVQFGYPISSFSHEGGKFVQYFEKARFEWWPGDAKEMVHQADLGTYFYQTYGKVVQSVENLSSTNKIDSPDLRVLAFVSKPSASAGTEQTVYVVAQVYDKDSQTWQPAEGARVNVTLVAPDLQDPGPHFPEINQDGISTGTVLVKNNMTPNSLVQIMIVVTYNGNPVTATTWFRVWW